jgi:hypothetical protein
VKRVFLGVLVSCAVIAGAWFFWLRGGVDSTKWAVDLVGGEKTLSVNVPIPAEDELYVLSTQVVPNKSQVQDLLAKDARCVELSVKCVTAGLAKTNLIAMAGIGKKQSDELMVAMDALDAEPLFACPLHLELTRLIVVMAPMFQQEDGALANKTLAAIKEKGGISHSIRTPACQVELEQKPYLARAYLFHLALLVSMSDEGNKAGWLYLVHKSGYSL